MGPDFDPSRLQISAERLAEFVSGGLIVALLTQNLRDPKMREVLERISPIRSASRITKPLFVVQGRNDPRVPWTESQQMVTTVKKNGTPVWFLMADNEGHGFGRKANQDFQFYATVAFVRQYLLP